MQLRKLLFCLLIGVALASAPYAIVNGQYTSTISGTVRCGGGCDTVGLVYGEPINVAGRIVAVMTTALDPNTGAARPDLPVQNAQTSFDATANGRYELQGVEPGIFDLYVQATGYPNTLFASGVTVLANQNLSIDAYVAPQGYTVSIASSTTQVSLTYSSTPSAVISTPSLQMPQPPQQTATQSTNNTQQLVLALAFIAAVVIGAAFLYARRKQQPKVKKTKAKKVDSRREQLKPTKAEEVDTPVAPLSTKTAEGKRLCIECGNELPPNLKFCDSCGAKQP